MSQIHKSLIHDVHSSVDNMDGTPFHHPGCTIIAGPSQCGKTFFVKKLIENLPQCVDVPIRDIIFCFSEWQPSYESLKERGVRFIQGAIDPDDLSPEIPHLVILDDLMGQDEKRIMSFFTKHCHHRNTSVFYLVQNLFHGSKEHRTMHLNCNHLILFKNPRDVGQVSYLSRQLSPPAH